MMPSWSHPRPEVRRPCSWSRTQKHYAPLIHEIPEAAGYQVLESSDPGEAVLRISSHDGPLDLVLTDVVMPRMSGPELVKALQATRAGVRGLFMSGYTNDAIGRQGLLQPGVHFLQKPFTSYALLGSVRATLDQAEPPA
jgi:two-component system, cell cycle sensor histidine kinase and response regulator CckA